MKFERRMALRYLRGARGRAEGRRFLRFITYVAVGGVAVGVAALLLSLSIVRGFSREIQEKVVGFGAHVQVENYDDAPLDDADALEAALEAMPHVTAVMPLLQEFILLRRSSEVIDGVLLTGVPALPAFLEGNLVGGTGDLAADAEGRAGVVLGADLARTLGLSVGEVVTAFSLPRGQGMEAVQGVFSGLRPRVAQFRVSGIYETSLQDFDALNVYTALGPAQRLLGYDGDTVSRFDLTVDEMPNAAAVAEAVEEKFGFPVIARTIYEVWPGIFAWVNLQETIIPLVIGVIIIVAAFNIIGTLLMIILEKSREIGVLASMGASPRTLRRLFLWLGLFIGVVGTGTGQVLALVIALLQKRYEIIDLPAEQYYMSTAPVELNALDFVLVGAVALALCTLAAYVPARVAARLDPIRVIRFR